MCVLCFWETNSNAPGAGAFLGAWERNIRAPFYRSRRWPSASKKKVIFGNFREFSGSFRLVAAKAEDHLGFNF